MMALDFFRSARSLTVGAVGCIALVFATAEIAAAQEWTRFRGPNGSGQSDATTIPAQWTEKDYNWKVELPGAGHSSPVLWGDTIFVTSADPQSGTRYALALAAADGHTLWKKSFPAALYHIHTQNSFATGTPAVDAKHVYIAWATPEDYLVLALDHDGREAWRHSLGAFESQHGFGCSPIVVDDMVVISDQQDGTEARTGQAPKPKRHKGGKNGAGGSSSGDAALEPSGDEDGRSWIVALDAGSGAVRWKTPRRSSVVSYATPCVRPTASGGSELIYDSRSHGFSGIDVATGHLNWELPVFDRRAVDSPILVGGLVLGACGVGSGNNTLFAIQPGDAGHEPKIVYKIDKASAAYVPTPVAKGNLVFIWNDRGIVTCIDGLSGAMKWRQRVGGNYSGSPVRAANRLYCMSTEGEVLVLAAGDKYEELGRNPLGEATRATPAIAGGRMYLRTDSHLVSIGGK
ncbi:MAG TPA: PQQ-binding-like beta-propeller repeat protein [Pirellulales bacterium]|jgi:outer membrane protein assembly factor BamB|nr:PQQ-binding-like beta-propeller repeat protein [Pirellulales bacterium]